MKTKNIQGVIYDLDGTIIDTEKINCDSWQSAADFFKIKITQQMLVDQKGMTDIEAAKMMLGNETELNQKFVLKKQEFVEKNLPQTTIFPNFEEVIKNLEEKNISVWICTSIIGKFVDIVFNNLKSLNRFKNKIIYKEKYKQGKPSSEALLLTLNKMGMEPENSVYVGDAYNDCLAAKNAKMNFVYFCPKNNIADKRLPAETIIIKNHKELLKFV